jgi:hypothetical protein
MKIRSRTKSGRPTRFKDHPKGDAVNTTITTTLLRRVVSKMKEHEIPPRTVKTRKEAREFTANDPAGHIWYVGDQYYLVEEKNGRFAVAP